MSHDKVKAAARERMAGTREPYAAARREVIREHQAASNCGPPPGSKVLLWINGPCGVGKKTTASELHRRLPAAWSAHLGLSAWPCTACCPLQCGAAGRTFPPDGIPCWNSCA
jgi:hypothetical protein